MDFKHLKKQYLNPVLSPFNSSSTSPVIFTNLLQLLVLQACDNIVEVVIILPWYKGKIIQNLVSFLNISVKN